MNKYEQLIEYIINDQEDKARELFHSIVVAKSRDIYESLMDETVDQYDQQGDLVDDVTRDENGGLGEADDEFGGEMDADDGMGGEEEFGGDDEMGGDMGGDEFGGDDLGDDLGGDEMGGEGEGDLSDKFQDIKSAIEDLEAEFNAIMGGGDEGEMGDGEIEGGDEMAADDAGEDFGGEEGAPAEVGAEEEEAPMGESANPFAKSGSGKSGSGKASGSGKKASGSGKAASGSGKAGSGGNPFAKKGSGSGAKTESKKSAAELMREYVEKISDGHGPEKHGEAEGNEIGSDRKKFPVNKTTPVAGKNDMGGTASNILSGKGNDTSDKDGQTSKAKAGGFMKAPVAIPGSERNVNKVGGNAGAQQFFKTKEKAKEAEGSTTKDSVPVKKDSLGYPSK